MQPQDRPASNAPETIPACAGEPTVVIQHYADGMTIPACAGEP